MKFFSVILVLALAVSASSAEVIDLGIAGYTFGYDLNNLGQVVGQGIDPVTNEAYGFVWSGGGVRKFGIEANGLNDNGAVVGSYIKYDRSGRWAYRAYVIDPRKGMRDLRALGGRQSVAKAINNRGDICGSAEVRQNRLGYSWMHAAFWTRNRLFDLGALPGGSWSYAVALNDQNTIVGRSEYAPWLGHAFVWKYGKMRDLGTLGGRESGATRINKFGVISGYAETPEGNFHACLWQDGKIRDLGTLLGGLRSWAESVNDIGQVVGLSEIETGSWHAFLWQDGAMTDLSKSTPLPDGWRIYAAMDINNRGEVLCQASKSGENPRAIILKL